jgi:hypothetical protein
LATCFGSSEPSSVQYLLYRHGAFSECAHYVRTHWPEDGSLEPKHVANYVLVTIHVLRLTEYITLSYLLVLSTHATCFGRNDQLHALNALYVKP